MIRVYIDFDLRLNEEVVLTQNQQHYLKNVMRRKVGDEIFVFNEENGEWSGIFCEKSIKLVKKQREPEALTNRCLAVGLIKQQRLETIVEKITEIGVDRLFLLHTDRSNAREANLSRLTKIAIEATEQSGRIRRLSIEKPQKLRDFLAMGEITKAFLSPEIIGKTKTIEQMYSSKNRSKQEEKNRGKEATGREMSGCSSKSKKIECFIIGPEGGFSKEEIEMMNNLEAICLGKNILRTETASIIGAHLIVNLF